LKVEWRQLVRVQLAGELCERVRRDADVAAFGVGLGPRLADLRDAAEARAFFACTWVRMLC